MNSPKISRHQKPSSKSKNKILKLLPRAAQVAVAFHNLPFSPGRDYKRADGTSQKLIKSHIPKAFSMIPQEPTSPKISCMGQIKHKKKICRKQASLPKGFKPVLNSRPEKISKARSVGPGAELNKKAAPAGLMKIFSGRRKSDAACGIDIGGKPPLHERAPSLSQMRKFASSRDAFVNFDWTASAQIAAEEDGGGDFYSDGEDDDEIPYSAPILAAAARAGLVLEPRKEINLWKRRTMARPTPLQLNVN